MKQSVPKRRPVLLIIALVISLIAFEVAREGWVIAENRPMVGGMFTLTGSSSQGIVIASGTWKRSDQGSPMVPGVTEIRCVKHLDICIEVTASVSSGSRSMFMFMDLFSPTEFSDSAVAYENDNPQCAKYSVRMDLAQNRVTATRDRKENPELETCKTLEPRIAMELGNSYDTLSNTEWMDNHFLPLTSLVRAIFY